jgi:riboflavin kinase/FMN adenylyltransferase
MLVIDGNAVQEFQNGTYVAIGSFDGLHIGHMALIDKAMDLAKRNNSKSMVYTFRNHPLTVINKEFVPKLIIDNDSKIEILESKGIDVVCLEVFDEKFMTMSPERFIKYIKSQFNVKGIIVGFNYRFGHRNSGNIETLKLLSKKYDFEVFVLDALKYDDEIVSSSRIRKLLLEGKIEIANSLLVYPFTARGTVVHGKKLGRTLGFPTANLSINHTYIYPKNGVYYTNVIIDNEIYKGITNIGYNPTVQGESLTLETNILNFNEEIYGKEISVKFINRIRDEFKFKTLDELIKQMMEDKKYAEIKNEPLRIK